MAIQISSVHHVTLTVSDVQRSEEFYTSLLGFQKAADYGPRAVLANGTVLLALTPPPDPKRAVPQDRFDENRIGLDHLSLSVSSRTELEGAMRILDERRVPHGEIKDLPAFRLHVLAFRDPDNIQLELTAPYGA
jgi:glyoxylase I family protein